MWNSRGPMDHCLYELSRVNSQTEEPAAKLWFWQISAIETKQWSFQNTSLNIVHKGEMETWMSTHLNTSEYLADSLNLNLESYIKGVWINQVLLMLLSVDLKNILTRLHNATPVLLKIQISTQTLPRNLLAIQNVGCRVIHDDSASTLKAWIRNEWWD